MSPQLKPTIKELDGLPAGEIDLRISQAENRTVKAMEDKLDAHREVIENRLDDQDAKLEMNTNKLSVLVGSDGLPGLVQGIKVSLDAGLSKQMEWHEADLSYRGEVKTRLGSLEDETKKLSEQVRMIRWFVATSNVFVKCIAKCLEGLKTEAFWKLAGIGFLLYGLEKASPWAFKFAKHILTMTGGQ